MIYAQLNEESICIGISQLSGKIENEKMIEIESYDTSLLGKRYVNGVWEEVPKEPLPEPEPTLSQEELQAEILLNQQNIITRQETQELVLSQLLLNQQGGSVNV